MYKIVTYHKPYQKSETIVWNLTSVEQATKFFTLLALEGKAHIVDCGFDPEAQS